MEQGRGSIGHQLAKGIVEQVANLIEEAEKATKPLEIDPYRGKLFELFVTAEAAGFVQEGSDPDLSAEGLCHALAERWGLAEVARQSFQQQSKLPPQELSKMRMLWSVMRMWIEWTYAWKRWPEFHDESQETQGE